MRQGVVRVERKSGLMLDQSFLIFVELHEPDPERVVSLDEIGIDLQSFLEMLSGGADIAGLKGFLGALEFLDGFRGDAELAHWDSVTRVRRRACGIRFGTCEHDPGRIGGVEHCSCGTHGDLGADGMAARTGLWLKGLKENNKYKKS